MDSTPYPKTCQACGLYAGVQKVNNRWRCQRCFDRVNLTGHTLKQKVRSIPKDPNAS